MIGKVFDAFIALIFLGMGVYGTVELYNTVRKEALIRVSRGLSSTYSFQRKIDGETFDWEK